MAAQGISEPVEGEGAPTELAGLDVAAAPARKRWRLRLAWAAIAVLLVVGVESVPGVPGHAQAALLGDLVTSDAGAATAKVDPFTGAQPSQPCAALESKFGVGNELLKDSQPIGWYASIWPSYQALDALSVSSLFPGQSECLADFGQNLRAVDDDYWADAAGGSPAAYDQGPAALHFSWDPPRVDDSLWMGLMVARAAVRTGDPGLLGRAEQVFQLAVANWDPKKGGVYWEDQTSNAHDYDKSVVSNAPAVILGVELYLETGQQSYLRWSEKIFSWLNANLFDPTTGLYDDHVDDRSSPATVDTAKLTYNQGLMVGAMALLSVVDPTRYPLANAVRLAERSMTYFAAHHSYGDPAFDAIWAETLLWTANRYGQPAFTRQAQSSVEHAVRAAPTDTDSLLVASSEMTLKDLVKLPPAKYADLFFTVPGTR